ncbi:hypothetical protein KFK14_16235 [Sphingobium phenoxybenzoativorans]|uniref:Uncharacterized protein n=1 Tax=Sphingobium phenoxybenzoativorans TaxID=1592790 RepID=A0A975K6W9_9SPHN|nr:hypothetical protein [Sphingobium phenoxybenzoativorans]QUT04582.1 hypothetical protein KFK14_16235 [Sphingobium phenoxybenzoativorans]
MVARRWKVLGGVVALALAIPVIAQQAPESLLPPGFGDPVTDTPPPAQQGQSPQQSSSLIQPIPSLDLAAPVDSEGNNAAAAMSEEELAAERAKYDFPDSAKRLLTRIGPLTPESGGFAANAFGSTQGKFLMALMRESRAPFASRWASILMRRALLSGTDTPGDVDGADWVAERAWLLLRMGEADAARMMIQSVDADKYTPRLYAIAMQTYLATADPAGLCPLSDGALRTSREPGWVMSRAFCASFSGDQGSASGALNQAQRDKVARGIDYRLAEKVVGAGNNARRSVKVEWDGVDNLTAWRFGLATATNVEIPDTLYATVGPHVRAWEARASVLPVPRRRVGVETAARLGVFSSAALVGYYSELAGDAASPADFQDRADALRTAYSGANPSDRLDAMRTIWTVDNAAGADYVGLIAVARAAAALPVMQASSEDMAHLIAAMLTAGYDRSAIRWSNAVSGDSNAQDAWALLAVGAPSNVVDMSANRVSAYVTAAGPRKGQMLVAGLAALNRLSAADAGQAAQSAGVSLAAQSRWSRAIGAAAQRGERATVAILAGVGLQVADWGKVPPEHVFHIVAALHRVGLDPEARMIAAEAITRS